VPKIKYIDNKFQTLQARLIELADHIIREYQKQGFDLTLRQLYYQFVRRDLLPEQWFDKSVGSVNNEKSYKKLGDLISNARDAGMLDWNSIVDRSRTPVTYTAWETPADIIAACASQFRIDKWQNQPYEVTVWVEKEALVEVVGKACGLARIEHLACKGYLSSSAAWRAGRKAREVAGRGKTPVFIHLGDHDPSGIDMTRDNEARISLYSELDYSEFVFRRIALTYDQVEQYALPPNPTKMNDSRANGYVEKYGMESWELDALEPSVLVALIREAIDEYRDLDLWEYMVEIEDKHRADLQKVADNWGDLIKNER
jgi:hypothetical protein